MVSYEDVLIQGIEYGLIPFFAILALTLFFALRRHKWRRGVYADLQLRSGPDFRKQYLPQKGMIVTKKYGAYVASQEGQSGTFKGKPLYRYLEGYPYPIVYTHDRIPVDIKDKATGKTTTAFQEIVKPLPLSPSSYRLSAYEKDRTHAQVYGGAARLELMLLIIVAISVFILIAVIAK